MSPQHLPPHRAGGGLAQQAARLALDTALAAGAALRVTRFATTDVLGGWVLADPAKRWASAKDPRPAPLPDGTRPEHPFGYAAPPSAWRHRLTSSLDCPYCVGTQATLAIAGALAAIPPSTSAGRLLRAACGALAASYLVGHVSYRLDSSPTATATATSPAPATAPATAPAPAATPTSKDLK